MGSKTLLLLVMCMALVLVLSTEVEPKDVEENFDPNDGVFNTDEVDEMKYRHHGGWHGGHGSHRSGAFLHRVHCRHGCCRWFHGRCVRCCFHHGERVEGYTDVEPHN